MKGKQANSPILKSTLQYELEELCEQLKVTGSELNGQQVHSIRVLCKRVRAESLLLKSKKNRAALNKLGKVLAGYLAPARDAQVRIETFDLLMAGRDSSLGALRLKLLDDLGECHVASGKVIELLECLLDRSRGFSAKVGEIRYKSIERAQQKSFKMYQKVSHKRRNTYHDWRKSVKSYSYLLKLFPGGSRTKQYNLVRLLAERLGALHDLHVFEEYLALNYQEYLADLSCLLNQREKRLLKEIASVSVELYR